MTERIKDSFTGRLCHFQTQPLGWRGGTTCSTLGTDMCHAHSSTTAVTVEHHFPELSLLNMVQNIGYANMHNAV